MGERPVVPQEAGRHTRPELAEDVDLELEHRKYLLDVHDRLPTISHYELLGVPRNAEKKAIKNAYYRITGSVHPDRFFRKRLGSYKPKMEAIFARLEDAYRTLTAPDARAQYDATLGPEAPAAAQAPGSSPPTVVDPKLAAKRKEAMDALKQHLDASRAKAKGFADRAARARAAGDLAAAADLYRQAVMFAPNDEALRRAHAEIASEVSGKLAESYARKAVLEERFGRWAQAVDSWQRVIAARPDHPEARARLAHARARASRSA